VLLLLVCVELLVLTIDSFEGVKREYSEFSANSSSKISSLNSFIFLLNQTNFDLNSSLINLNRKYNSLSSKANALESSYSDLKEEVDKTISKIDSYEKEIQSSLEWFNSNSTLGSGTSFILSKLKSNCKKESRNACKINLGCFHLVNSEFIEYKYKNDLVTSNTLDKLQSISEFISNKGGDCEDFSLFFKAEYNSLVNTCSSDVSLFAWEREGGNKFWANFDSSWYISNADEVYLSKENIFPIIVCGAIFDPQSKKVNGHCILAFSSKKISSFEDISVLNSAELIEPQTGEYLGFVGEDSGIFLISEKSNALSYIDTLITDSDFFIFRNNDWANYERFGNDLNIQKENLNLLIKN
jgi:hypothetical protein